MKTKNYLALLLFVTLSSYSKAQEIAFDVSYDVQETTYYEIDSNQRSLLLPQNILKLQPEWRSLHKEEVYYSDGTSTITTLYNNDISNQEDWLDNVTKTVCQHNSISVYVDDSLLYSEQVESESDHEDPCTFSAYYLSTNQWQLPINQSYINELDIAGFVVLENTATKLVFRNADEMWVFDKTNYSETKIYYGPEENEIKRVIMFYKQNVNNHFVYDVEITKEIINDEWMCYEKTLIKNYENIQRNFHHEACKPEHYKTVMADDINSSQIEICGHQISNTSALELQIPEELPDQFTITVKDIYGMSVTQPHIVNKDMPIILLENIPTGVYSIHVPEFNVTSCKFVFQP